MWKGTLFVSAGMIAKRHMHSSMNCPTALSFLFLSQRNEWVKGTSLLQEEKLKWLEGLGDERAEWLRQLPFSLSVPYLNLLVVHAGLIPGIPLEQQSLTTLTEVFIMILC